MLIDALAIASLVVAPLALVPSGVAKLTRAGAKPAWRFARATGIDVPVEIVQALAVVEVALGLALPLSWGHGFAALAIVNTLLMATFLGLVVTAKARRVRISCGCRGTAHEGDRVTEVTIARNVALTVLAASGAVIAWPGDTSPSALVVDADLPRWLLAAAFVAAFVVLAARSATVGAPPKKTLPTAEPDVERLPFPHAWLESVDGTRTTIGQLVVEQPQVLLAVSGADDVDVAAIRVKAQGFGVVAATTVADLETMPEGCLLDRVGAVAALGIADYPAAVLLGADGLTAGGPVYGPEAIDEFVDEILDALHEQSSGI